MKRRKLIQNLTGLTNLGIMGAVFGPTMSIVSPKKSGIKDDWHEELTKRIAALERLGDLGEIRWVDDGIASALWVKTSNGWKKSELL